MATINRTITTPDGVDYDCTLSNGENVTFHFNTVPGSPSTACNNAETDYLAKHAIVQGLSFPENNSIGNSYTLPIASSSTLGGVKVGSGLSINATTGVLDATGGGGGGGGISLYDLTAGVPSLSSFTTIDATSVGTFTENSGRALNIKVTGTTPTTALVIGLSKAVPSTPYSVAILCVGNFIPLDYTGIAFGWYDTSSGKLDVVVLSSYTVAHSIEHSTFNSSNSRASVATLSSLSDIQHRGGPLWLHLTDDGTNVSYGISNDGVNYVNVLSFAKSGGFLTNYNQIFIGYFPDGQTGNNLTGTSVTIYCYDENGLSRTIGGNGGAAKLTDLSDITFTGSTVGQVLTKTGSSSYGFTTPSSSYTLPAATLSTLGGIKVGDGLNIDGSGVLSVGGGIALEAYQFSPPLDSDWSWADQNGGTRGVSQRGIYITDARHTGWNISALYKTPPSTPYTVEFGWRYSGFTGNNYNMTGIGWYNPSNGKYWLVETFYNNALDIGINLFTNSTTQAGTVYSDVNGNSWTNVQGYQNIIYARLCNDGTNYQLWLSTDGQFWIEYNSYTSIPSDIGTSTPSICFYASANGNVVPITNELIHYRELSGIHTNDMPIPINNVSGGNVYHQDTTNLAVGSSFSITHNADPTPYQRIPSFISNKYYDSVLMYFDGTNGSTTFTEEHGINVVGHGNAALSTGTFKYGTASLSLPQSSSYDYLEIPYITDFNLSNQDFTLEAWINITALGVFGGSGQNINPIISHRPSTASIGGYIISFLNGNLIFYASTGGSSWDVSIADVSGVGYTTGTWIHVAGVRHGNTFTLYRDGSSVNSTTNVSSIYQEICPIYIGGDSNGDNVFKGYIDDVRITIGKAIYTSNFTPPTTALPNVTTTIPLTIGKDIQIVYSDTTTTFVNISQFPISGTGLVAFGAPYKGSLANLGDITFTGALNNQSLVKTGINTFGFQSNIPSVPLYRPLAADYTTWVAQNGSSISDVITGLMFTCPNNTSDPSQSFVTKALNPSSTTFEICMTSTINYQDNKTNSLILKESSTGKHVSFGFLYLSPGAGDGLSFIKAAFTNNSRTAYYIPSNYNNKQLVIKWYRIRINSGNIYYEISNSGETNDWVTVTSNALTSDFTTAPDLVGFGCSTTTAYSFIVHSFREY